MGIQVVYHLLFVFVSNRDVQVCVGLGYWARRDRFGQFCHWDDYDIVTLAFIVNRLVRG